MKTLEQMIEYLAKEQANNSLSGRWDLMPSLAVVAHIYEQDPANIRSAVDSISKEVFRKVAYGE